MLVLCVWGGRVGGGGGVWTGITLGAVVKAYVKLLVPLLHGRRYRRPFGAFDNGCNG